MNERLSKGISRRKRKTPVFNSFYEEYCKKLKLTHYWYTNNISYSKVIPQTGTNFHVKFQNLKSPKFLPERQQIERITQDPHLTFNDKLSMMESMEPRDIQAEKKLIKFSKEMEHPLLVKADPFSLPLRSNISKQKVFIENSKQKRRTCNENVTVQIPFNDNYYDSDVIEYPISTSGSDFRNIEEDEQPCSSCGGKNKKPPTKTDSNVMTRNNKCNCKEYPNECLCRSKKVSRSIYNTW